MGKPPEKGSIEFLACQLPRLSRTIRPVDLVRAIVHEDGLGETGLVAHPKSQEARLCLDL